MNRLVIIAMAVLVPFGVLVVWGLSALHDPVALPSPPAPVAAALPAPAAIVEALAPPPAVEVAAAPAPAALSLNEPQNLGPVPTVDVPAQALARQAVVQQLEPIVHTCFTQTPKDGRRGGSKIATTFDVRPDGTVADVRVRSKRLDPGLTGCVTAALQGAVLDPKRGIPEEPMHHTFHFKSKR